MNRVRSTIPSIAAVRFRALKKNTALHIKRLYMVSGYHGTMYAQSSRVKDPNIVYTNSGFEKEGRMDDLDRHGDRWSDDLLKALVALGVVPQADADRQRERAKRYDRRSEARSALHTVERELKGFGIRVPQHIHARLNRYGNGEMTPPPAKD